MAEEIDKTEEAVGEAVMIVSDSNATVIGNYKIGLHDERVEARSYPPG